MAGTPHVDMLRSPLGRARGLGSAKAGSAHWRAQRTTGLALLPLSLWFIYSVIHLAGAPRAAVMHWMSAPVPMVLMLALIIATFHHLQMGLQTVIEDYVHHEPAKMVALLLARGGPWLLGLICFVSVLKIGF
ncbi:succinate dehydrogenase, hydrophobic membrane anchor protein [Rhodopila globiformis]|uniref:Succinate dehydrogenase hydrophobic membrane anchor subunit n=1 Tax=Rhodopila globiformis TaxID=1071 RepID=A0A2S6NHV0_RHOGL|nr:succinate dehydrogenase, hydrophobic membrane anchor protein [Rhodopila globiformis]PPQ34198.1 succinate dehydrogenase, hydrophobic membrane anchor protein [Rhodopila globiformis]